MKGMVILFMITDNFYKINENEIFKVFYWMHRLFPFIRV